jgi:phospholipid/cholesterol/gamma-HCH transport system substrate-binding protein
MPRTRSLSFSELKVGILAVVATAIVATVILMLSGAGGFFWQRYALKARFPAVPGLKSGAPVRVAGVEVGSVGEIAFVGSDVEVTFQVSKALQPRLTTDSVASLGSLSLLGQATIDLTPSTRGQPIPAWGYVRSGPAPGQLTEVAAMANRGLEQTTLLLQDLRGGRGTLGRLVTDDAVYLDLERFISAAERVTRNLERGRGTLGRLATDPAAYEALQASLESLSRILAQVNAGEGSLGRLLRDDRLARSLTATGGNLVSLTSRLNRGEGTAGRLLSDPALYDRLAGTADRLERLVDRLDRGRGTVGQLLQDERLYENMNGAASELRALVGDIRKDPRKFLSVQVHLF